jgi:protein-S-isoprenylcysteine O-methyltransferase Ste14
MKKSSRHHVLDYVAYLLMVLCFPLNPLVLLHVVEPFEIRQLFWPGAGIRLIGMVMVIYPFIYFKRKGGVDLGKAYVHTTKIVTGGLYGIVRHVLYTGGILSIFIATPLLYPHWIFVLLGIPGIWLTYLGTKREDAYLVEKFGEDYRNYMKQYPASISCPD